MKPSASHAEIDGFDPHVPYPAPVAEWQTRRFSCYGLCHCRVPRPYPPRRVYTKQLLEDAARQSISVAGVLRILGLRQAGGTQTLIAKRLREYGVDTSHFRGQTANSGVYHRGPKKKSWRRVLVKRESGNRRAAYQLRRALIESGVPYQCSACNLNATWNDKPLMLQVNHKNRDWLDDRPSNLEFICPNCHSQTPGWCGGKGWAEVTSIALYGRERRKRAGVVERQTHRI